MGLEEEKENIFLIEDTNFDGFQKYTNARDFDMQIFYICKNQQECTNSGDVCFFQITINNLMEYVGIPAELGEKLKNWAIKIEGIY